MANKICILDHPGIKARGVSFHPNHIRRLEKQGKFPKRVRLGPNRVGWLEHEIDEWIVDRIAERDGDN